MLWLCTAQVMPRLDLPTVATCKYLRQRRAPCWCLDVLSAGGLRPGRGGNAVKMSCLGQGTTGALYALWTVNHWLDLTSSLLPVVEVNLLLVEAGSLAAPQSTVISLEKENGLGRGRCPY